MSRIAALVVAYHSAGEIHELAASLGSAIGGSTANGNSVDLVVLDNSGDPAEVEALSAAPNISRFIASGTNLGYGAGMNAMARAIPTDYDWLLVCNPDIRFEADTIDELIRGAERHPASATFGPQIVGNDDQIYPSARAFPSIRTGVGHALFANVWPGNPWTARYHRKDDALSTVDIDVDWLSGACLLVRPSAFHAVGGFDDGYFMYFEDVDLCWRLAKAGWTATFIPHARILHSGAHSTRSRADQMRKEHHKSAARFLSKKYAAWWLAPVRWVLRLALFLRRELPLH